MTARDIKKVFHQSKVQISSDAIKMVQDHLHRETEKMAQRCKEGNYKRLTVERFWIATGDWGFESPRRGL